MTAAPIHPAHRLTAAPRIPVRDPRFPIVGAHVEGIFCGSKFLNVDERTEVPRVGDSPILVRVAIVGRLA